MTRPALPTTSLILSLTTAAALFAQAPAPPTPVFTEKSAGTGPLDRLWFRPIGPATPSGRVDDLAVLESDPTTFYVAMATAASTRPPTPARRSRRSSTTKARGRSAPSRSRRPTPTWCGSAPARATTARARRGATASTSPTDGGRSWKNMGLRDQQADREDHRRSGRLQRRLCRGRSAICGPRGGERGVYKTTDGGLTWKRALHVDDDTGATELVMDPSNNKTLYAATYQRRRAAVGHERRRRRQRHLEVDRRRRDVDEARDRASRPARKGRIGLDVYRAQPERPLRARRARRPRAASTAPTTAARPGARLSTTNPRPMYFGSDPHRSADRLAHLRASASRCTSPTTAARRSATTAPRASTSITTRCGSTRTIRAT